MKRYKVTLTGSDILSWYRKGIGPTDAISQVVALLREQGHSYISAADLEAEEV